MILDVNSLPNNGRKEDTVKINTYLGKHDKEQDDTFTPLNRGRSTVSRVILFMIEEITALVGK